MSERINDIRKLLGWYVFFCVVLCLSFLIRGLLPEAIIFFFIGFGITLAFCDLGEIAEEIE